MLTFVTQTPDGAWGHYVCCAEKPPGQNSLFSLLHSLHSRTSSDRRKDNFTGQLTENRERRTSGFDHSMQPRIHICDHSSKLSPRDSFKIIEPTPEMGTDESRRGGGIADRVLRESEHDILLFSYHMSFIRAKRV